MKNIRFKTFLNVHFLPLIALVFMLLMSCGCHSNKAELPYLGQKVTIDGKESYHKVGKLNHFNQDSVYITNDSLKNFIYVTDFFFTSCPSICPRVIKEMYKIYQAVGDDPQVKLLSVSIDPKRDTVKKLKLYADNLKIDHSKWYFLTGEKEETFQLANTYFVAAFEDASAPGGFDHSGKIILVDKDGHVRSFSEGTDPKTTPKLIEDIKTLSASYRHANDK